jgi:hypothetical protein
MPKKHKTVRPKNPPLSVHSVLQSSISLRAQGSVRDGWCYERLCARRQVGIVKSAAPIMADRVVRSTLPDTTVRILTSFILFGEPAEAQAAINKAKSFYSHMDLPAARNDCPERIWKRDCHSMSRVSGLTEQLSEDSSAP